MLLTTILYIGILHYFESGYLNSNGDTNNGVLTKILRDDLSKINFTILTVKSLSRRMAKNKFEVDLRVSLIFNQAIPISGA